MLFRIDAMEVLDSGSPNPNNPPHPSAVWNDGRKYWTIDVPSLDQLAALFPNVPLAVGFTPSVDGAVSGYVQIIDGCPDTLHHTLCPNMESGESERFGG